jgi:hypothetical protein
VKESWWPTKPEVLDIWPFKEIICRRLVAHTCNPSYSGGRDQEDLGSKSARANSVRDPISK